MSNLVTLITEDDIRKSVQVVSYDNPQSVEDFGSSFSNTLSNLSSKLVASDVSVKAMGEIGSDISIVLNTIEENDPALITKKPSFLSSLFGKAKNNVTTYMNKHKSVKEVLKDISSKLENNRLVLSQENEFLEDAYNNNVRALKLMEDLISFGKEKYNALEGNLNNDKELATQDSSLALTIRGQESTLNRFGQKLVRLETAKSLISSQLPQIKIMQEINNTEIDTLKDVIDIAIPMWESQIGLFLSSLKTDNIISTREKTEQVINATIKKNSELLSKNLDRAIAGSTSTVITIETVRSVHSNTIQSVAKVKEATKLATQKRQQAYAELAKLDQDMKTQLLGA